MNDNSNVSNEFQNTPENLPGITENVLNSPDNNLIGNLNLSVIRNISGWGMFRAVIDIISGGFSCLGGIFFLFISLILFISGGASNNSTYFGESFNGLNPEAIKTIGAIFLAAALIYPVIGVIRIIYSINLIKAIDNLKRAVALKNESCIVEFLNKLSKYFKFNGITTILKISLYVIMIILYIVMMVLIITAAKDSNFMNDFNNTPRFFD